MPGAPTERGSIDADRVELILQELDSLPTLGSVAVRLLQVTADEDASADEIISLVKSDPALASGVLSLCRCHERGRAAGVTTVDRAVLLLGFEAVRCAVLSVKVFEFIDSVPSPIGETRRGPPVFDREAFWLHSLAVAVAAEKIAAHIARTGGAKPDEAFTGGLLHDIGQLVLHVLLPESFDQVCRVTEAHTASLDSACRQIIGIDPHTAGKRLAEHWKLSPALVDVIWLSGQPYAGLPAVPHRSLIAVVSLADAVVRSRYINPGGNWAVSDDLTTLCAPVGITLEDLDDLLTGLHEEVAARADALGLNELHCPDVLLRSLYRANQSLTRANAGMRQRERVAHRQARILELQAQFLKSIPARGSFVTVLARVAGSAAIALGTRARAALYEPADTPGWRRIRLDQDGRPFASSTITPPAGAIPLEALLRDIHSFAPVATLMSWVCPQLEEGLDPASLSLLPIKGGETGSVIVLLDAPDEECDLREELDGLVPCWQAALTGGRDHDRADHLTEQLAATNRFLVEAQEALGRSRTMSTLGEVAAGAAHEMNNPLTVISGRSQLLASRLTDPEQNAMAQEIVDQAHRLSDMISALRSFAEPLTLRPQPVDITDLAVRVVQRLNDTGCRQVQISTVFAQPLPPIHADPDLLAAAIEELLRNAVEAKGSTHIELRIQTVPADGRLKIEVRDNGEGLDEHTLKHAFDPFFSCRPAGRQPGLGLSRARRSVDAHGGRITLASGPRGGAVATIWLPQGPTGYEQDRPQAA